jgi:predicted Zn-dependent protease
MRTIAHYYDGITARAHDAGVMLGDDDSLEIQLADSKLVWPLYHPEINWQRTHQGVRIQYGEHPRMVLVVHEPTIAKAVVKALKGSGKRDTHDSLLQHVKKAPLLVALALSVIIVLCYFYVLPPMAEHLAEVMPTSADEQLGQLVWGNLGSELNVDHKLSATLQEFADQLELSQEYDLKCYVVDEPVVNAFALPGGHIVVYTGIIERMDRPNELVALLAHESVHVDQRHSTRQLMREISGYAFISLMLGDVNSVLLIAAEHADQLRSMSFSRELETEADTEGMHIMYKNNVDPEGMVELMSILQEEGADLPEAMEFLSTHPLTSDRIDNAIAISTELGKPLLAKEDLEQLFKELQNAEKPLFVD